MKIRAFLLSTCLGVILSAQMVSAVSIQSVNVSWDVPRTFIVSGKSDRGDSGEKITLEILNPGKTMEDFTLKKQGQAYFVKIGQTTTGEDGSFEYSFNIEDATSKSGTFLLRIKDQAGIQEIPFEYASETTVATAVNTIVEYMGKAEKDMESIGAIGQALEANLKTVFYIEYPLYDRVISAGKMEDLCECLSYMTPAADGREMAKDIKIATAVAAAANGIEAADSIFYEYGDILGVAGLQEYQSFAGYEGAYKTVFCQMFNGQTTEKILKAETFADLFGSAVVLTDLSSANGTGAVAEVLEKYNGYFDLSKYTKSDYQREICSAISKGFENGKIKTIEDVQKLLDADYTKQTSGGGNSGGTKNNGGSGGVSAGILPSVNQQPVSSEETAANQADYQFYDLENVEWARDAIEYLAKTSVLSGKEKGVFAPSENLTRAQACTILCRMFSIPEWDAGSTFTDIAEGDWCKGYVMAANQMGIVMGQSEKFFGADSDITRQDFVVMLKRAMDYFQVALEKNDTEVTFIDAENIREYALESVKAFSAAGIISGRDDGSFDPTGRITRAEAARVAYNVKMIYEGRK